MHPARVLRPGFASVGAGLSGTVGLVDVGDTSGRDGGRLELAEAAIAPGAAPWVSARVGVRGDNEGGLTYAGRTARLDGRHAFALGGAALSVGVGASAVLPGRPDGHTTGGVRGVGFDVPVLIGAASDGDLYAVWAGPRAGVELLGGRLEASDEPSGPPGGELDAEHVYVGGLVGARAGFRHVHAVVEVSAAFHHASGTWGPTRASVDELTITPSAAIVLSF
jgi:hypothetical protein